MVTASYPRPRAGADIRRPRIPTHLTGFRYSVVVYPEISGTLDGEAGNLYVENVRRTPIKS